MTHRQTLEQLAQIIMIAIATVVQGHRSHAAELQRLVLAGGCFWCVESDFERVPGVTAAVSGFAGGTSSYPTYKQVTQGGTRHYEAVELIHELDKVNLDRLLFLFLRSIDPTDPGGQFCDRGDSYRSAIFVSNPSEKDAAKAAIAKAAADLGQAIVTPILSNTGFYPAESYHQNYYKGSKLILTRFGPKRQSEAYRRYRKACGRDTRVIEPWGSAASFAQGH